MIAFVKGIVADTTDDTVVVEVGGIGYNIKISSTTVNRIPVLGTEIKIYTYTLVREDAFQLYGFLSKADLDIFKLCITVNGIGPKGALALLSVMDADALCLAILSSDAKAIAKAPGIGKKTAERLILDLKDKLSLQDMLSERAEATIQDAVYPSEVQVLGEAIEALVALGYGNAEAMKAVKAVQGGDKMESGVLLKAALKNLF